MVSAQATGLLKMPLSTSYPALVANAYLQPSITKISQYCFSPDRPPSHPAVQPGLLDSSNVQDISLPKLSTEQLTPLLDSPRASPGSNFSQGSQDPVQGKQHLQLAGPELHGYGYLPCPSPVRC